MSTEQEMQKAIKRNGEVKWLLRVITTLLVSACALLVYWSVRPYEVLDLPHNNTILIEGEYKPGDVLTYEVSFCKKISVPARLDARLTNGTKHIYESLYNNSDIGCLDIVESSYIVPEVDTADNYTLTKTITYRVNPIREVQYHFISNEFTIIGNE